MNTALLKYFDGTGTDNQNRTLDETLNWSDEKLESVHDYIQWWFPTFEPSDFNPSAPLLDHATAIEMKSNIKIKNNLLRAWERFEKFLFDNQEQCLQDRNHNYLRITRMLSSARSLGLNERAEILYNRLIALHREGVIHPSNSTRLYWADAAGRKL